MRHMRRRLKRSELLQRDVRRTYSWRAVVLATLAGALLAIAALAIATHLKGIW